MILERSGIGDAGRLRRLGIETVVDLPGVGENLQDHLQIRPIYKVTGIRTLNDTYANLFRRAMMGVDYALRRRGPLTMAPSQVGAFVRSSAEYSTANLEFHFQPLSLDNWGDGLHPFPAFTASVCNLRPTSRGSVHISGPEAEAPPTSGRTICRRRRTDASPSLPSNGRAGSSPRRRSHPSVRRSTSLVRMSNPTRT